MKIQRSSIAIGALLGASLVVAGQQVGRISWLPVAAPVELAQLVIRRDAKGDGHFGAPRSGNVAHRGVDIEAPLGSSVLAIRSGRVIMTGRHRGRGLYLELDHGRGLRSLYAHLQTIEVDTGDRVRQGQRIGTVGKTGNARHPLIVPHLHLEVSSAGALVDPSSLGLALVDRPEESPDAIGGN
jgi:murein DD-endopeptidase MepM/ murein hydrolase activator NlpD